MQKTHNVDRKAEVRVMTDYIIISGTGLSTRVSDDTRHRLDCILPQRPNAAKSVRYPPQIDRQQQRSFPLLTVTLLRLDTPIGFRPSPMETGGKQA